MCDIVEQNSSDEHQECVNCETEPLNLDINQIIIKKQSVVLAIDSDIKRLAELKNRRERRHKIWFLSVLSFGNFCVAAGISLQGPFFPKEAEMKGATPMVYSSIFAVYELVMLLTSFKFGQLVTKIPANLICGFGLAVAGISTVSFGILDHLPNGVLFIGPAFAVRIVESLGATAFATSSYSLITYRFSDNSATMFSVMETCFGLGLIVGPVIGGTLYEFGGYSLPFIVLGITLTISSASILMFVTTNQIQPTNYKQEAEVGVNSNNNNNKEDVISITKFLLNSIILLDSLVILTALSLIGFCAATLEPHIRHFELSPLMTGLIFVTLGITYAITAPILGKLCDIYSHSLTLFSLCGTLLSIIGLILIGPMPGTGLDSNLWLVIVALLLFGMGTAAKQVSGYSHALNYCIKNRGFGQNKSLHGLVSGLFFSCISLGGFIGPTIAGIFVQNFDFKFASLVMFAIEVTLFLILLFCFITKKTKIS
ncbi:MFS-type transporter SLC18B1-like [Oppia nitens]|uniref:MFS-type transporter SLC18B1-like n=1 Tax=Oppia nitens TaxID=1686743 RepID=UPI0023DB8AFA|nr:MFS-type transporter SLC18B1-like [Oppia nitens]